MSTGGSGPFFQNSFYVGNMFNGILYGVELVLYFQTMRRLRGGRGFRRFLMFFSTMILFCITVFVATQSIIAQEMWVIYQDWPGGPAAYFTEYISAWYETLGSVASTILQLMSDGLLIHRCWTVWCGKWKVVIFPCMLWLASLGCGIADLYASGSPNTNFYAGLAARIGVTYFTLTISLNVVATSIICWRIISYGRTMRNVIGEEFASTYFNLASIIVESALPYTLSGIAFLVAFGMESEFSVFLLSVYSMFTCISPQMLILRVAEGRAWTRNTGTQRLPTIAFAVSETVDPSQLRSDDDGAAAIHFGVLDPTKSQSEKWKSEVSSV